MRRKSLAFLLLLASSAAAACVDSHPLDGTRPGHERDGGVDAGPADVGDGDGDGDGDVTPDAGPPPPSCDPADCQGATSMLGGEAPPCCTEGDRCGLDATELGLAACLERNAPGVTDSACASASLFGFVEVPGCCAREGKCGHLIMSFLPLGCVPSDVALPIPGLEATTPASCAFNDPE